MTPASAASMPAEILPKSNSGWISFTSVRVKTLFQLTSVMRASGDDVWRQLSTPIVHLMFGDGARMESRSPCGSQFSFASVTCASDAAIAAAFACSPGFPRTISRSCGNVSFLAHACGAAAMTARSRNREVRWRTTHAFPIMASLYRSDAAGRRYVIDGVLARGLTPLPDGDTRLAMARNARAPRRKHTPVAPRVETEQLVLPGLTNTHGTIFGGMLMQWIDIAAGISAARHAGGPVVTASMDRLHFLHPIHLGEVVTVQAQVNFAARTPMEVGVRVLAEGLPGKPLRQCTRAYLTFVAVDEAARPREAPPLVPETAEEKRRFADARRRRAVRLRERRAMTKPK